MSQSLEKLQSKVSNLRSEVIGERRRIAYLEAQLQEPRAHEKHVEELYRAVVMAWRCMLNPDTRLGSENWMHEGNGDDCIGNLARLVPEHYWHEAGVRKSRAESIRWPISEAVRALAVPSGEEGRT